MNYLSGSGIFFYRKTVCILCKKLDRSITFIWYAFTFVWPIGLDILYLKKKLMYPWSYSIYVFLCEKRKSMKVEEAWCWIVDIIYLLHDKEWCIVFEKIRQIMLFLYSSMKKYVLDEVVIKYYHDKEWALTMFVYSHSNKETI